MILACSHPNSFFDALIIGAYHHRKIHFLARGDAFAKPWAARLLRMLNMIPIYRISEGKENLDNNKQTFEQCIDILKANGTVLIFSEGISINEWRLRPLKKGTARLAWMCWAEHGMDNMIVQPTGINYNSFTTMPKLVQVAYAPVINSNTFHRDNTASFYKQFNEELNNKLQPLVLSEHDGLLKREKQHVLYKTILALPALLGWLIHKPLFSPWSRFVRAKTEGSVFYDSVLFAGMLIWYPLLVVILTSIIVALTGNDLYWGVIVAMPFTAWCYLRYKGE